MVRDWSSAVGSGLARCSWRCAALYANLVEQGKSERDGAYGPIVDALHKLYPSQASRLPTRILVPGAGLGRLAFDLWTSGFTVQANEFSMFMVRSVV